MLKKKQVHQQEEESSGYRLLEIECSSSNRKMEDIIEKCGGGAGERRMLKRKV